MNGDGDSTPNDDATGAALERLLQLADMTAPCIVLAVTTRKLRLSNYAKADEEPAVCPDQDMNFETAYFDGPTANGLPVAVGRL